MFSEKIQTLDAVLEALNAKRKEYKLKEVFSSDTEKSHGETMHQLGVESGLIDAILIVQKMRLNQGLAELTEQIDDVEKRIIKLEKKRRGEDDDEDDDNDK